jgi:hypothetical protein
MSRPSDRSPDELLLHFVERLPTTVRDIVLARCCLAYGRWHPTQKQDLFATFRAILQAPEGEMRAYMCAKITAVIELALHDEYPASHATLARELLGPRAHGQLGTVDLESPLTQKHWRAAKEEFLGLRRDGLNVESIHRMLGHAAAAERRPADSGR